MTVIRPLASWLAPATTCVMLALTSGCAFFDRAAATWDLAPDQEIDGRTTVVTVLVTRLDCNSGVTGKVNKPTIELTEGELVVTFNVSPGQPDAATCEGNDQVPYDLELPEPLGDRRLVDGGCDAPEASGTEPCQPDGVRYAP